MNDITKNEMNDTVDFNDITKNEMKFLNEMNDTVDFNDITEKENELNSILISRSAEAAINYGLLWDSAAPHRYTTSTSVEEGELVSYMIISTEQGARVCMACIGLNMDGHFKINLYDSSTGDFEFIMDTEQELNEAETEVVQTSIENNYQNVLTCVHRILPPCTTQLDEDHESDLTSDEEELIEALSPTQQI